MLLPCRNEEGILFFALVMRGKVVAVDCSAFSLGAVFAEDVNTYNCMMERSFESLNKVAQTYSEKQRAYSCCTVDEIDPSVQLSFSR